MPLTAKTGKKQNAHRFQKGVSGNPLGRRAGSRNKATMLLEKMMADDGEGVVNAVLEAATVYGSLKRNRTVSVQHRLNRNRNPVPQRSITRVQRQNPCLAMIALGLP
jgi:hypothetical protein